jgi:hypothetical protein
MRLAHVGAALCGLWIVGGSAGVATAVSHAAALSALSVGREIVVTSVPELDAALSPENSGQRIIVRAGTYLLDHPLQVPDGTELIGEGLMHFDEGGLPDGFLAPGRTVLASTSAVVGDFVTLGNESVLQNLVIQDSVGRVSLAGGGVVTVSSRTAGDVVLGRIFECEIINPNPPGLGREGPTGRGVVAITRNLNFGAEPAAHDDSVAAIHMERSLIRSPAGGSGVFAINFAARSRVELQLARNVIGGGLDVSGGVSRPDSVTGSITSVRSYDNRYRSDGPSTTAPGWLLTAGAGAPVAGLVSQSTSSNVLAVHSVGDRIVGFKGGILAAAGKRFTAAPEASSGNEVVLFMEGATLQTTDFDFQLYGARSMVAGMSAGDDNVLRAVMRRITGSGLRTNKYADSSNPSMSVLGLGNQLEIEGSLRAFDGTNAGILPLPPDEHFRARQ